MAAMNVCLFWLPLIEVSSLMTPHKTDHHYGVDNVWGLWKLYLIEGRREAELAHLLAVGEKEP